MKKLTALILILSLTLPLLFACAPAVSGDDTGKSGNTEGTGQNGGGETAPDGAGDSPGVSVPVNDWYKIDDTFDMDPSYIQSTSISHPLYATDETVYMYHPDEGLIMFIDKATGIWAPLCGKPECLHNDETCGAYVGSSCYALRVYDGKLYWLQGIKEFGFPFRLVRCGLDGTSRETVWTVDVSSSKSSFNYNEFFSDLSSVFIHRGYIYFTSCGLIVVDGESRGRFRVAAMPIDGGEPFMILDTETDEGYNAPRCCTVPLDDDVYIMLFSGSGRDLLNDIWGTERLEFYKWNSETKKTEELIVYDNDTPMVSVEAQGFLPVRDDGIYFQKVLEYQRDDGEYDSCVTVCKYSFETGEIEDVVPRLHDGDFDSFFFMSFTKDYILGYSWGTAYVFDYEGNLVAVKENLTEYEYPSVNVVGADEKYIYYYFSIMPMFNEGLEKEKNFFLSVPLGGGELIRVE